MTALVSGYAFMFTGPNERILATGEVEADWKNTPDDEWELELATPTDVRNAAYVGQRKIDGKRYNVWRVGDTYFAQLAFVVTGK